MTVGTVLLPHMFCCAYYVLARLLRGLPRLPSPAQMCISLKTGAELKEPVGIPASCFQQHNGTLDNGRALRETLRTGVSKPYSAGRQQNLSLMQFRIVLDTGGFSHFRVILFKLLPLYLPRKNRNN